jgi:hypothetical protein
MTRRSVGTFATSQEERLVASKHHKKKCWYLWKTTRRAGGRSAGDFGTSQFRSITGRSGGGFEAFFVDTRDTTTEHSCACHTRAPTMPRDGAGQDGQDRTGQDRTRARGGSKANTKTMPSADFEASDEIA